MKKILFFVTSSFLATAVAAQTYSGYSYSQDRVEQGYSNPYQGYPQNGYPTASAYDAYAPAPTSVQAYGFYQQPAPAAPATVPATYGRTQQSQMMWYPTQQQRAVASGYPYPASAYYMQDDMPQQEYVSRSPVYNSKATRQKKSLYADVRLGIGGTPGWGNGFDTPIGPVWGIALGTRLSPTVRVDAEFAYHTEAKLATENHTKVKYRQYDLGANVYYDFPTNAGLGVRPFVGAGIWGIKGKASAVHKGFKIADADSDIKLGMSVAGGVVYPINEMFSAVAMARARYIDTEEDLFNIEGFVGLRYHF